jgi:SAM-dependent methyltransferase
VSEEWWRYENLDSGHPYDWTPATRGDHPDDDYDFHLDLGAGKVPKGRLALDRHGDVDIIFDLDSLELLGSRGPLTQNGNSLPFPDDSIESIITHHCLEHIGTGFMRLMDECYRVLVPGGVFRIIVPSFPTIVSVQDPDHCRNFCWETLDVFCHNAPPDVPFWSDDFAEPYTTARFQMGSKDMTPAESLGDIVTRYDDVNSIEDITIDHLFREHREIRCTLHKPE